MGGYVFFQIKNKDQVHKFYYLVSLTVKLGSLALKEIPVPPFFQCLALRLTWIVGRSLHWSATFISVVELQS